MEVAAATAAKEEEDAPWMRYRVVGDYIVRPGMRVPENPSSVLSFSSPLPLLLLQPFPPVPLLSGPRGLASSLVASCE